MHHSLIHFFAACDPANSAGLICGDALPHTAANRTTLNTIFLIVFTVIGGIAFLFLVIGGARYVLAQGNPENIQRAKNQILYSLIGLVIAALAATVVNFVIDRL